MIYFMMQLWCIILFFVVWLINRSNKNDYNNNVDTNNDEVVKKDSLNIHLNSSNIHLSLSNIHLNSFKFIEHSFEFIKHSFELIEYSFEFIEHLFEFIEHSKNQNKISIFAWNSKFFHKRKFYCWLLSSTIVFTLIKIDAI